ncbi:hypothetical protein V2J09_002526 [Rumex salicifolius]
MLRRAAYRLLDSTLSAHHGSSHYNSSSFGMISRFYTTEIGKSMTPDHEIDLSTEESRRRLFNRVLYRSKQRGFLELDLVLGNWVEQNIRSMDETGVRSLVNVLDQENPDLWKWLTSQEQAPETMRTNQVFIALHEKVMHNLNAHSAPETRAVAGQPWVRGWDDFKKGRDGPVSDYEQCSSLIMSSSSTTLRRRLHHGDVDGRRRKHYYVSESNDLNEPLLGNDDKHSEGKLFSERDLHWNNDDDERRRVQLHWSILFSQIIDQWANWLASLVGSGSIIGRLFSSSFTNQTEQKILSLPSLSPLQEERLRRLQRRLQVPFDGTCLEHQDALKQLWILAFPDKGIPPLKSELWKEMGWQGTDPSTDFRGGGFISLENLIYFADKYPASFQRLLHKTDGSRAEWEYPFAVAGVNISFVLAQMLDLQSGKPTTLAGVKFLELLAEDDMLFDNLFCVTFQMMDSQWLARRASYMEFNDVLKSTKAHLEKELELEEVSSIKDLPAYTLLTQ